MTNKYIELILNNSIKHLGNRGDIIKVSMGYARNYLLPTEQACLMTNNKITQIQASHRKNILLKQEEQKEFIQLKYFLEIINKFTIKKMFSNTGQIFGSVSEKDICKVIFESTGKRINKNQILLSSIKHIGKYPIKINLTDAIIAEIEIQVLPDKQI